MSKLPPEFVKAPVATNEAKPRARRTRKSSMVAAPVVAADEVPRDPRELLLRLTDDELQALEEARQALVAAGQTVTLEQMLHRVLADWTMRMKQPVVVAPVAAPAAADPATANAPALPQSLLDRIRELAAAPLRTWRELGATLRRLSGLALR